MTQAVNLANFANNLDSSGGLNPSALNAATPVSKGGTGATTISAAQTNLNVPSVTGSGASGTWSINVTGTAASTPTLISPNFTVYESSGKLYFQYGSTVIGSLDSSGNFIVTGNVTGGGTP